MRRSTRGAIAAVVAVIVVVLALVGVIAYDRMHRARPAPAGSPAAVAYAEDVSGHIELDALVAHLQKLQDIGDANGGNRETGSPGYDQSVDFVAAALRDAGFDVETPEAEVPVFRVNRATLTVDGKDVEAHAVYGTRSSPKDGATGPLVVVPRSDDPEDCSTAISEAPAKGAVLVVDRAECHPIHLAWAAHEAGAVGLVIANDVEEKTFSTGIWVENDSEIPVLVVSKAVAGDLRKQSGQATVVVDAKVDRVTSRNVIAQTKTGATDSVVMVGAHLDSVAEGPGINDNGSGVATVLETALQLGSSPPVDYAIRFAFWTGEEQGLFGSDAYVRSLDVEALKDIAVYLNFDLIASENPCYFTSDGNQSSPPDWELGLQVIPEGSPGVERTLVDALETTGVVPEDAPFDGRSDYQSFTNAGIPVGNMDTGAEELKTKEQAEKWGGTAGIACDDNYHSADDTLANVNRDALDKTAHAAAYTIALYSRDQSGRNGLPARDDRTRHVPPTE